MSREKQPAKPAADGSSGAAEQPIGAKSSSLDELAGRLTETTGINQDTAMLLAVNWQRLLWGLVVVLLVVWLAGYWKESRERAQGKLAEDFQNLQDAYTALGVSEPAPDAARDKADTPEQANSAESKLRAFKDNIERISHGAGTYRELGLLYRVADEVSRGEFESARVHLEPYRVEDYLSRLKSQDAAKAKAVDADVLAAEMASLLYLRLLIGEGKAEPAQIRAKLQDLVAGARFVNVEALIMLFRVGADAASRKEAQEAARKLAAERSYLAETIKSELGAMGIRLG
ncbi:MAG TPA: hypothetical protein PLP17_13700 [Oligoflexia bacterium]|nr:hypothetical protein [Oligoflexia bacterium]